MKMKASKTSKVVVFLFLRKFRTLLNTMKASKNIEVIWKYGNAKNQTGKINGIGNLIFSDIEVSMNIKYASNDDAK